MSRTGKWILSYFFFYITSLFIFPMTSRVITLSVILGMIMVAPARMVKKSSSKRLLTTFTLIGIVVVFVYLLYTAIPIIINGVKSFQSGLGTLDIEAFSSKFREPFGTFIEDLFGKAGSMLGDILLQVSLYISKSIASWITFGVLLIVASAVLTIKSRRFLERRTVETFFPRCERKEVVNFFEGVYRDFQGYITGQLIVAVTIGTVIGLGAFVFGIKQSLFLGLLAGITNLIPFVGVIITAIPLLVMGYTSYENPVIGIIVSISLLVVANQLEMWVLSPRIMSKRLKLNWFIILLSMIASSELFGAFGIVLAIPVVIFVKRYWKTFVVREGHNNGDI
ncbi:AI-2E family transporter [Kosmotoga pacifica]|uniref:AI-2E family transporter n=1 Tax=Kosmotoga pacifica TaxID=1330330 RepID=UPI00069AD3D3|nr:AI-2E family transporter [Kosmotoga pacifica]